jgi:hypothetical protein
MGEGRRNAGKICDGKFGIQKQSGTSGVCEKGADENSIARGIQKTNCEETGADPVKALDFLRNIRDRGAFPLCTWRQMFAFGNQGQWAQAHIVPDFGIV